VPRAPGPGTNGATRSVVPPPGERTGRRPVPDATARPGEASARIRQPRPGEGSGPRPVPNGRQAGPPATTSQDGLRTPPAKAPVARPSAGAALVAKKPGQSEAEAKAPARTEHRQEIEPAALTTEMEPIGEETRRRRKVDQTLARFSAVHDEMVAEEHERLRRKKRFMPWIDTEDELSPNAAADVTEDGDTPEPDGRSRAGTVIKLVAVVAATLVLIAFGIAWGAVEHWDSQIKPVDALDPNSSVVQVADKQRGDENFLLAGANLVLVAHVPADHQRIVFVSFPGNTAIPNPACGSGTLATAFAMAGALCVTKLVQQESGLLINHFLTLDADGFTGMVDAIGAVELCTAQPLRDGALGTVLPDTGVQHLSGDTALKYVRARDVAGDPSPDLGQIRRQQRFMAALLRTAARNKVLASPTRLNNVLSSVARSASGDNVGVAELLNLAQSIQHVAPEQVVFTSVPASGPADATKALFTSVISGTPLPDGMAPAATGPLVDPKTVKFQVLNGGNTNKVVSTTADQLKQQGFQPVLVDPTPGKADQTVIRYADDRSAEARTLAAAVPSAKLRPDPSMVGAVALVIGPDFNGSVVPPRSSAAGQQNSGQQQDALAVSTLNGTDTSCQ